MEDGRFWQDGTRLPMDGLVENELIGVVSDQARWQTVAVSLTAATDDVAEAILIISLRKSVIGERASDSRVEETPTRSSQSTQPTTAQCQPTQCTTFTKMILSRLIRYDLVELSHLIGIAFTRKCNSSPTAILSKMDELIDDRPQKSKP